MKNYKGLIGNVLLIITIFILFGLWQRASFKNVILEGLNEAASDSLKISRNENGELVGKITALETQNTNQFLKYKTTDSLIKALQADVKENKKYLKKQGSVTNFSTKAEVDTTVTTTVIKDSITPEFPTYKSKFNFDGWIFGSSIATKDTTSYKIGYKDDYSLVIGLEPQGFLGLGKAKPFGEVTSSNPYNEIKTMRTYQVSLPKKKNFSLAPSVNFGVDVTGQTNLTFGLSLQPEKLAIKF